jgi:outer membrane protein assembly factor BamB
MPPQRLAGGTMRGRIQGVEIWVVVLIAVAAWASAGVLGLGAGHALLRNPGNGTPTEARGPQAAPPRAGEVSNPSARALLDVAATQVYAGELTSPNAQGGGNFGLSLGIGGATIVVGAPDETASSQIAAGHAYTFNARTGALIATFTSPNAQTDGHFGDSVAISGTTVVVGAPGEMASGQSGAGHAYTFNARTGVLIATLTSPNAASQTNGFFGTSVAISGTTVVVAAPEETASSQTDAGHVYAFNARTGAPISTLSSPNAQAYGIFGASVAISGTTVVVGADGETVSSQTDAGHAYTFNARTGALFATLTSPNAQTAGRFGATVAISGATVTVGAPFETVSSLSQAGHAYTFNARTGAPISILTSSSAQTDGYFGLSLTMSGTTVVVGADDETASGLSGAGNAYAFNDRTYALVSEETSPNAQTDGYFGHSVAMSGRTIAVGAPQETAFGFSDGGIVYLL